MRINFANILMIIVGSIDLHNSLHTFSIRIVWQLRIVTDILVLNTTQGKKNVVHLHASECNLEFQGSARDLKKKKHCWRSFTQKYLKITLFLDKRALFVKYYKGQYPTIGR